MKKYIEGRVVYPGSWPKVEIVKIWSERDVETILSFSKSFNDEDEANLFMQSKMFKAILKDVIKGLKDE